MQTHTRNTQQTDNTVFWIGVASVTVHFLLGTYAFMTRTSSDSYSDDDAWFVISNSAWIGLYCACLIIGICVCLLYTGLLVVYGILAVLFRLVCLISIVSAHTSNATAFKIDEFYGYSVYLGFILEPVVFVLVACITNEYRIAKQHRL